MTQEQQDIPEGFKEYYEELKRNRLDRWLINAVWFPALLIYAACTKDGWEALSDPESRRILLNREARAGLLEDAIIGPTLHHPQTEETALTFTAAPAGRWVGYDFHRPKEFGSECRRLHRGRLYAFPLEKILPNAPDRYTPTNYLKLLDLTHLLQVETPAMEQLAEQGLVSQTTYEEAFTKASIGDRFRQSLLLRRIADAPVYQITPKGNGLVFLDPDSGEKTKEPNKQMVTDPLASLGYTGS